jgi:cation diffusion facilitator family transporter
MPDAASHPTLPRPTEPTADGRRELDAEKRFVAGTSVLAAVVLTTFKAVVGIATGSLGILSEAAHSLLDFAAAVMTWLAVRASAKPADQAHTYGHGKVESLSALFETLLLAATCVWIVVEAVKRLFFKAVVVEASPWGFVVMAVSIVIDVSRSRALLRVAKRTGSQALEADALHFSTDVWSSAVVIFGLALVFLAPRLGLPWLVKGDTVAALMVAAIVIWVSVQLGRKAVADLLDEAPPGLRETVASAAWAPGVREVSRVRLRRSGHEAFVDVTLKVAPDTSLERGHQIADTAEKSVQQAVPGADVMVHVEPADNVLEPAEELPAKTVRRVAGQHGFGVHSIRLQAVLRNLFLELHVEVPGQPSVAEAHDRVSRFEDDLRRAMPRLNQVVTHIEPADGPPKPVEATPDPEWATLETVHSVVAELRNLGYGHDVKLARTAEGLTLTLHWAVPPDTPLSVAHEHTEHLERTLRGRLPSLARVVIHVEPAEPDRVSLADTN